MCSTDKRKRNWIRKDDRVPDRVGSRRAARADTHLVVSEPRFRRFYKMILKLFMTCIAFAYKGWRDFDTDLVGLKR